MRSDLVKAAAVLGICMIVAGVVVVVGLRWAIQSALEPHTQAINVALARAAEDVSATVDQTGQDLQTELTASVDANSDQLNQTLQKAFTQPVLVSAPEPLPIRGMIAVQGPQDGGPAVPVNASILGDAGGGGGGGGGDGSGGEEGSGDGP